MGTLCLRMVARAARSVLLLAFWMQAAAPLLAQAPTLPQSRAAYVAAGALASPQATQAAAADEQFVYAVSNNAVTKYDRATGKELAKSSGAAHHLNSAYLYRGQVLCAHSNYPRQPHQSDIRVLDPRDMELKTFHAFADPPGSLTWAVRKGEDWWCHFAHYGKDNHHSVLLRYDDGWKETGRWTYPPELVADWGTYSLSGGLWLDEHLLTTGHDKRLIYRLKVPTTGKVVQVVDVLAAPFPGQGLALDPKTGGLVGIDRAKKQVVFARLQAPAGEAKAAWKVGLAQVKITPEQPVPMSGYGSRTRPFEKVAAELYVKALVLEDAAGQRGVIVTSDVLGFSAAVAGPICARIQQKTGLPRSAILLNSSHTHAGPLLTLSASKEDGGEALRSVEYTKLLQDKVVEAAIAASKNLQPARLSWGGGVIHFAMNRREFTLNGVILGVNPRGRADRSVPVLRVDDSAGKLRAVLFGAGVHGTTLGPDNYQLCGDYAGFAQEFIEKQHPGAQAMFMLGCAGDANPYPRGTMELTRKHGAALGEEVNRVLAGKLLPVTGPLRATLTNVTLPLEKELSREQLEQWAADKRSARKWGAERLLAQLKEGKKPAAEYTSPVGVWQFGQDLTLIGLPGEVVVDYVPRLEKALGPNKLWVAGYCNDVFGYLPSARVLSEGGYETRGLYAGGVGFFAAAAEDTLVRAVRDLAGQAGRKLPD